MNQYKKQDNEGGHMNELVRNTITSMEVAEMVGKNHKELLRDIRKYCEQLGESKIALSDFFTESTYTSEQNRIFPCYLVTKKRLRIYCSQDDWTEGN